MMAGPIRVVRPEELDAYPADAAVNELNRKYADLRDALQPALPKSRQNILGRLVAAVRRPFRGGFADV